MVEDNSYSIGFLDPPIWWCVHALNIVLTVPLAVDDPVIKCAFISPGLKNLWCINQTVNLINVPNCKRTLAACLNFIANGFIVWRLDYMYSAYGHKVSFWLISHIKTILLIKLFSLFGKKAPLKRLLAVGKITDLGFNKTASSTHLWIRTRSHCLPPIVWSLCASCWLSYELRKKKVSNLILNNIILQDKLKYIKTCSADWKEASTLSEMSKISISGEGVETARAFSWGRVHSLWVWRPVCASIVPQSI